MQRRLSVFVIASDYQAPQVQVIRKQLEEYSFTVYSEASGVGHHQNHVNTLIQEANAVLVIIEGALSSKAQEHIRFALRTNPKNIVVALFGHFPAQVQKLLAEYIPIDLGGRNLNQESGFLPFKIMELCFDLESQRTIELETLLNDRAAGVSITAEAVPEVRALVSADALLAAYDLAADNLEQQRLVDEYCRRSDEQHILDAMTTFYHLGQEQRRQHDLETALVHLHAAMSLGQALERPDTAQSAKLHAERAYTLRDLYYQEHNVKLLGRALDEITAACRLLPGDERLERERSRMESAYASLHKGSRAA